VNAPVAALRGCPRKHQKFFVFFGHFIVKKVISFPFPISKLITQNPILDTKDWVKQL